MNLPQLHATARFHYHTNPEVGEAIEDLAKRAALAALGEDAAETQGPPHAKRRFEFLCLCAEEFYIVGEVVAVPLETKLPLLVYPGEVGVILKPFDPKPILSWKRADEDPRTLPPNTIYLRRPSTPFDMRGVPLIRPDGTFTASDEYESELFAQQAEELVRVLYSVDLGPELVDEIPPEDEDTGEEPEPEAEAED